MTAILRTRQLTRTYESAGAVHALRGVDLDIQPGEFIAIMGPSGCGKSTLLHLLAGLDSPTSGEIYLGGARVDQFSEAQWAKIRRRQLGYMFQAFNLVSNMTAADNIELPALLAGTPGSEARKRRQELMEQLGIADKAQLPPSRLSGGQQQRVALARALINEPDVLIADEPTGNLDSQSTKEVLAIFRECHERGQTVVLVTHDSNVASAADRVLRMRDGLLTGESRLESRQPSSNSVFGGLVASGA